MGFLASTMCVLAVSVLGIFGPTAHEIEGRWHKALLVQFMTNEEINREVLLHRTPQWILSGSPRIARRTDSKDSISAYCTKCYLDISSRSITACWGGRAWYNRSECNNIAYRVTEKSDARIIVEVRWEDLEGKKHKRKEVIELVSPNVINYGGTLYIRANSDLLATEEDVPLNGGR